MAHFSVNDQAVQILEQQVLPNAGRYQIAVHTMKNGGTLVDMGVHAKGGWLAGKAFAETCLGGMGTLTYKTMMVNGFVVPVAAVHVDRPHLSELSAHAASFYVQWKGKRVSLSGPFRAIKAEDVFARVVEYQDADAPKAVAHFQTDTMPDEELFELIAQDIGREPKDIYLIAARTGTLTGTIQVSARNVEQVVPSLVDRGFDVTKIVQACGYAPILSVVDDERTAYGRVNDGLIYGQETNLYVDCEDEEIESILHVLPFSKNADVYGTPFLDLFSSCDNQWSKVPRDWDAPSKINFYNMRTNRSFVAGRIHYGVLEDSLLG